MGVAGRASAARIRSQIQTQSDLAVPIASRAQRCNRLLGASFRLHGEFGFGCESARVYVINTPSASKHLPTSPPSPAHEMCTHGSAPALLSFFRLIGQLKLTRRAGWVHCAVHQPESVLDHTGRVALMALSLCPPGLSSERAIKLSLVHDLAESLVGDITPRDNVSKSEKHARELAAMEHIRDDCLRDSPLGRQVFELWLEYEEGTSSEALFVKELDKLEMIIQADEYERQQHKTLDDFFDSTQGKMTIRAVTHVEQELRRQRQARREQPSPPPPPSSK